MSKSKIDSNIKNQLFSADNNTVISGIKRLKETGNKSYLPILFELLINKPEEEVEKEITHLLGTIKDKETIPIFIDALQEEKFLSIQKIILSSCWSNGMDFSSYLSVFVDLVIKSNWETAFEAFTVIDNLDYLPKGQETKDIKLKLAKALKSSGEEKIYFLEEILKML